MGMPVSKPPRMVIDNLSPAAKTALLKERQHSLSDDDLRYISQFTLVISGINGGMELEKN